MGQHNVVENGINPHKVMLFPRQKDLLSLPVPSDKRGKGGPTQGVSYSLGKVVHDSCW